MSYFCSFVGLFIIYQISNSVPLNSRVKAIVFKQNWNCFLFAGNPSKPQNIFISYFFIVVHWVVFQDDEFYTAFEHRVVITQQRKHVQRKSTSMDRHGGVSLAAVPFSICIQSQRKLQVLQYGDLEGKYLSTSFAAYSKAQCSLFLSLHSNLYIYTSVYVALLQMLMRLHHRTDHQMDAI